jgi:hypothetical protein
MNDQDEFNRLFMRSEQTHLQLSLLSFEKRKIGAKFLDANLIRVAIECRDTGRLMSVSQYFWPKCILQKMIKDFIREKKHWGFRIPYLIFTPHVEPHRVATLLQLLHR